MTYLFPKTLLLAVLGLVFLAGWAALRAPVQLVVQPDQSTLRVEGTSSLHDWTCEATTLSGTLDVEAAPEAAALVAIAKVKVTVPAAALECNNGTMNRKTRDALKADEAPEIRYTLQRAAFRGDGTVEATGLLRLAGVERAVTMTVKTLPAKDGGFRFTGSLPLKMTDYDIKPPTAMLGALKTGDRVVVSFDILAR